MTDLQKINTLIEDHLYLATQMFYKYTKYKRKSSQWYQDIYYEEIHSAALEGLVKAAHYYHKKDIGLNFKSFASARIRYEMQDEWRRLDKLKRGHRRDVKEGREEMPMVVGFNAIKYEGQLSYTPVENLDLLISLIQCLNRKDFDIIYSLFYGGSTGVELAKKYNCSTALISLHKTRILKFLKLEGLCPNGNSRTG